MEDGRKESWVVSQEKPQSRVWGIRPRWFQPYVNKFFKADLSIFVLVSVDHEFLNDLPDFVSREGKVGFFEEFVQLIVTDESVAVEILQVEDRDRWENQSRDKGAV